MNAERLRCLLLIGLSALAAACSPKAEECSPDMASANASGVLRVGEVDIDYSGGPAEVRYWHVRDVDAAEDGCVQRVSIRMMTSQSACLLELSYSPTLDQALLSIDDNCPGWEDSIENEYDDEGGPEVAGVEPVAGNVGAACVPVSLQLTGMVSVTDDLSRSFSLDLSPLSISGTAYSEGSGTSNGDCPFG